jgi:hypothetical protein
MIKNTHDQKTESNEGAASSFESTRSRLLQRSLIGVGILVMVAFWGTFAYAVMVRDLGLLEVLVYMIAIGAGLYGAVHFLSKLYQHISKA